MQLFVLVLIFLVPTVIQCYPEERRDPKWFFTKRTLTTVQLKTRVSTEMIPSSCAVVNPTLTPCRNVRKLDIKPSPSRKMQSTQVPAQMLENPLINKKSALEPSDDDGSWFWGGVTTVTQPLFSDVTVKVQDPNTVVTFSVKGCKPTELPFNLPFCTTYGPNATNVARSIHTLHTADLHYIED